MKPAADSSGRPAVFLDRDGTIIEDTGYLRGPKQVHLLPGAASAIKRLNQSGFPVVVVTNQSGIARGLMSLDDYQRIERRLDQLLAGEGARLDGHYFCPHLPELSGPCQCRKPGTLLYSQAAERLNLDLARSWWVGDRVRDLIPALSFGGRGILVQTGAGGTQASDATQQGFIPARDLADAAERIAHSP